MLIEFSKKIIFLLIIFLKNNNSMNFVQSLTGHGGWPMSCFLTPDLKPFYGGIIILKNIIYFFYNNRNILPT